MRSIVEERVTCQRGASLDAPYDDYPEARRCGVEDSFRAGDAGEALLRLSQLNPSTTASNCAGMDGAPPPIFWFDERRLGRGAAVAEIVGENPGRSGDGQSDHVLGPILHAMRSGER